MAKASAAGSTVYVPEGADVPVVADGVRLVGPGASVPDPGAVEGSGEPGPAELVDAEPGPESAPEVEAEDAPAAAVQSPQRPAAADPKADWVAWAVTCGLDEDEAAAMTKAELQHLP